jgi:hypothetical protein
VKLCIDRARRSKATAIALAKGRGFQGRFGVGDRMDDALAVDRALRGVNVSWSVGMAIGVVVRMVMRVVVRVVVVVADAGAAAVDLFDWGHGRGSVRVARVDVGGLFQVVLSEVVVVVVLFLLVLVQLSLLQERCLIIVIVVVVVIVFDVCGYVAGAPVADRDGDVVDG